MATDQDARDLAIMRLELRASRRADGSIVESDIKAQRHLANAAKQWIITRERKDAEAKARGRILGPTLHLEARDKPTRAIPTSMASSDSEPNQFLANRHRTTSGEDILVFSDSGQEFTYRPPKAKLDSPYKAPIRRHKSRIYRITAKMQNAFGDKEYDTETPIRLIDLQFAPGEQKMPTQKPVSLLEYIVKTYSKAGDTVFDPTAGLFSTGAACFNTFRRFIGIEKDAENFRLGVKRLRELGVTDGGLAAAAN